MGDPPFTMRAVRATEGPVLHKLLNFKTASKRLANIIDFFFLRKKHRQKQLADCRGASALANEEHGWARRDCPCNCVPNS